MEYQEFRPSARLDRFVECYWSLGGDAGEPTILPDGHMEIVFHLGEPPIDRLTGYPQPKSLIVGQMLTAVGIRSGTRLDAFGIRLRPAAPACVLQLNPGEMLGRIASLADVDARVHRSLWNCIGETADVVARVDIAESWLQQSITRLPDPVAEAACGGGTTGLSARQLRRRFSAAVGMCPVQYRRVVRFQHALRLLETHTIAGAAVQAGYSDQAHLHRDFLEFSGFTPRQWLRIRPAGRELALGSDDRFLQDKPPGHNRS